VIYVACGLIMMVIGILWLISPAKRPNRIYGYLSYLAQVNKESFKFAQRRASLYCILFGLIQVVIGLIIHFFELGSLFSHLAINILFIYLVANCLYRKKLEKVSA
jgi:hypothetical protein